MITDPFIHPSIADSESMVDGWLLFHDLIGSSQTGNYLYTSLHVSSRIHDARYFDAIFFCIPPCRPLPASRTWSCREMRFVWLTVRPRRMYWYRFLSFPYQNSSFGVHNGSQFLRLSIVSIGSSYMAPKGVYMGWLDEFEAKILD